MDIQKIRAKIPILKSEYNLKDIGFDTECIYEEGNLSELLKRITDVLIPEHNVNIRESISEDGSYYTAIVSVSSANIEFRTQCDSDWLSDEFFEQLENLPKVLKTDKVLYSINPLIGLTGQEAWYFYGTTENLKSARKAGLPIIFPGEDPMQTEEFQQLRF